MDTLITTLHIILCLLLMIVILLQAGKGAEIGAVFGGSSQTIFGSRGAATFLSKVTTICAVGFMVTSISLVYLSSARSTSSVMDTEKVEEQAVPEADSAAVPTEQGEEKQIEGAAAAKAEKDEKSAAPAKDEKVPEESAKQPEGE